jgi:serine/threonine-protein kinase
MLPPLRETIGAALAPHYRVDHEMLAGEPPFTGATAQAVLARHLADQPRPMRSARQDLPARLEEAVLAALAKDPSDRAPTAAALVGRLVAGSDAERAV